MNKKSKWLKLNKKDLIKGFVMAVIGSIIDGFTTGNDIKTSIKTGLIIGGGSYLVKNLVTDHKDKITVKPIHTRIKKLININMDTWDKYTNARVKTLHPAIMNDVISFINEVQLLLDIKLRVTQAMRTIEEQDGLYNQGRTKPGNVVTNAKGGCSYHNYGLAFDVVEIKNKQVNWDTKWKEISSIAATFGFEWGGNFKSIKDKPHFQKSYGFTTKELHDKIKEGRTDIEGFVNII